MPARPETGAGRTTTAAPERPTTAAPQRPSTGGSGPTRPTTGAPARPTTGPISVRGKVGLEADAPHSDRRSVPRANHATPARVAIGSRQVDGRVETISTTGLSVTTKEALPEGTAAMVRFALPLSGAIVSIPCAVIRSAEHRGGTTMLGLSFTMVSAEVEREIEKFVAAFGDPVQER